MKIFFTIARYFLAYVILCIGTFLMPNNNFTI